jgi:peptidoglycan lytic transglycosylase G
VPRHSRAEPAHERTEEERERAREERARRRADRSAPAGGPGRAHSTAAPGQPAEIPATTGHPNEMASGVAQKPDASSGSSTQSAHEPASAPIAIPPVEVSTPSVEASTPPAEPATQPADVPTAPAEAATQPAHTAPPPPLPPQIPRERIPVSGEVPPAGGSDRAPRPQAPAAGSSRPRRGRSSAARVAAVVALAIAVVAVLLLVRALRNSRDSTSTTAAAPTVVKILIPEGKTRAQIAQIAAAAGLTGSYLRASVRSRLLNPASYGAPPGTPNLEGFLFPATYDMDVHAPTSRLAHEQLIAFQENFGPTEIQRARALHITPYELLTVASMVEREARVPGDRAKIAAVIYNRLRSGMPLGIDATIYYAVELRDGIATYTHELSEAQLHIDSPYNTRLHTGLPPTPISNPGLASIRAAAYPARVPYLFYVAAADGCGEQVFSRTLAEFEAEAAAYRAAVSHNGGHPPSCKKK